MAIRKAATKRGAAKSPQAKKVAEEPYVSRGEKKEQTRQALMDAAIRVLQRRGFRATTLQAIAEEADLHVQTLYRHFPNRSSLFSEMVRAQFDAFRKEAMSLGGRKGDFLTFYEEQLIQVVHERGVDAIRSLIELFADPESGVSFQDVFQEYEDLLAAVFARELGSASNDQLAQNLATLLFWGNLSTVRRATAHGDEESVSEAISAFIESVRETLNMYRRLHRRR